MQSYEKFINLTNNQLTILNVFDGYPYLLYCEDGTAEYYIELKGSDVPHAIDQLRATIMKLGGTPTQRMAIVACTKVAPHITTQIQKAKKEFRSRFNSLLLIKESPVDINLE